MMKICETLQEKLAEEGKGFLEHDGAARAHLGACSECSRFLAGLTQVDSLIAEMRPVDAPEALIQQVLQRVREQEHAGFAKGRTAQFAFNGENILNRARRLWARVKEIVFTPWVPSRPMRYAIIGTCSTVAIAMFIVRAQTSLFFGDFQVVSTEKNKDDSHNSDTAYKDIVRVFQDELKGQKPDLNKSDLDRKFQRQAKGIFDQIIANTAPDQSSHEIIGFDNPERYRPTTNAIGAGQVKDNRLGDKFEADGDYRVHEIPAAEDEKLARIDDLESNRKPADSTSRLNREEGGKRNGAVDFGSADATKKETDLYAALNEKDKLRMLSESEERFQKTTSENNLAVMHSGQRVVSIDVNATSSVEGWSRPGSNVDVVMTYQDPADGTVKSKVVQSNAKVLSFSGETAAGEENQKGGSKPEKQSVTLLMGPEEANKMAIAKETFKNGQLSLVLRGDADSSAEAEQPVSVTGPASGKTDTVTNNAVDQYLDEQSRLSGLTFKSPTGYWANTYIPGDPVVRQHEFKLQGFDRTALEPYLPAGTGLEKGAFPVSQPFDAPKDNALAVFLHANQTGIEKETRMLLQVGLKATERHSGSRPQMNVGLVLDLNGEIPTTLAARMRSLVDAFRESKYTGDRFSLTVSGKPGGTVASPEEFTHGYLSVTMNRLFSNDVNNMSDESQPVFDLVRAFTGAIEMARTNDDPNAPLGTSVVVLITSRNLGSITTELEALAHQSAISGIPVSVIGVGKNISTPELDKIVLAGQGNRRLLEEGEEVKKLVEEELFAVSRVVARAVRLRIRLHPGVKLIDVLGSKNLDKEVAQRVREAEQNIDRRIAKNFGITADRGEDEEGIQIVIPSFYSGDSHVILLDVVAPGPGAIADVTVRYKDLVFLRNGVSRANLSLDRKISSLGPLEQNVQKNALAYHFSETLKRAGRLLYVNDFQEAIALVQAEEQLYRGFQQRFSDFSRDTEMNKDIAVLGQYLAVLNSGLVHQEQEKTFLAHSLAFAGYSKVLPRPVQK